MRVLIVPKWYPWPERPVFGIFCREQAHAVSREHDVVVLASEAVRVPGFAIFALSDGVEDGLRTLRLRYRRPLARPAAMAAQTAGMLSALRSLRREGWAPEIVHAHTPKGGLLGITAAWLAHVPVRIYHIHGLPLMTATGYKPTRIDKKEQNGASER